MKRIFQPFAFMLAVVMFAGCKTEEPSFDFKSSIALSVFVTEQNQLCITSLVNRNNAIFTEYRIDKEKTNLAGLKAILPTGAYFRTSIDDKYMATTVYNNLTGEKAVYQFPRNYRFYAGQLFYLKDGQKVKIDTTAQGAVYGVDASEKLVVAGFFGRPGYGQFGEYLEPTTPFYLDADKKIHTLPMPRGYFYFNGVSAIHRHGTDVYVAGKFDFPMYWKNSEVVRLHQNYGEINQVKVVDGDAVYAVGCYNKKNHNSVGHTACYWVNEKMVELEDNAVAYSIALVGKTVYVAGAVGRNANEYKACYWRDGERFMLED